MEICTTGEPQTSGFDHTTRLCCHWLTTTTQVSTKICLIITTLISELNTPGWEALGRGSGAQTAKGGENQQSAITVHIDDSTSLFSNRVQLVILSRLHVDFCPTLRRANFTLTETFSNPPQFRLQRLCDTKQHTPPRCSARYTVQCLLETLLSCPNFAFRRVVQSPCSGGTSSCTRIGCCVRRLTRSSFEPPPADLLSCSICASDVCSFSGSLRGHEHKKVYHRSATPEKQAPLGWVKVQSMITLHRAH